jgi:chromosome segregation ATPase
MGKLSFVLFLVTVMMGVAGRMYYTSTQETIMGLNQNIATLQANVLQAEQALETSNETIQRQQEEAEQVAEANALLRERLEQSETYKNELAGKLSRHNLTQLTLQRPGRIETIVNEATESIFDELENLTGKPADISPE